MRWTLGAECPVYAASSRGGPDALTVENFSFASIKNIKINGANVAAFRISYVGEQGWELHCAYEDGQRYGLRCTGRV